MIVLETLVGALATTTMDLLFHHMVKLNTSPVLEKFSLIMLNLQ
jgi:hypothetical protein